MSQSKRQKTSATGRADTSPAAAAAASSSSSSRRVVGRRSDVAAASSSAASSSATAAAAASPSPSPARISIDGDDDDANDADDEWYLPEPSVYMTTLPPHVYSVRLEPTTAPVFAKFPQSGLDAIVGEVMKFILQKTSASQVITHTDIKNVLGERCKNGANYILADARRRFMELYGYELHELMKYDHPGDAAKKRKSTSASSSTASAATKTYILRTPNFVGTKTKQSGFSADLHLEQEKNDTIARKGLLFWIYAFLHAEESSASGIESGSEYHGCPESKLWRVLGKLAIDKDMKSHETLGNIQNLMDDFVKHHYLLRLKLSVDPNGEGGASVDSYAYRIGHRGQAEISTSMIYRGMCQSIMGQEPSTAHLNQIKRNEDLARGKKASEKAPAPVAGAAAVASSQR